MDFYTRTVTHWDSKFKQNQVTRNEMRQKTKTGKTNTIQATTTFYV